MYTELIWLFVVTGIATAQQEGPTKEPQTWSTVDTPLDEDTDAATDAVSKYLGFSCPKGYRCLPVIDCFPCDYGTWKDNDGSGLCEKCPPDCTTLRKGAQSREECVPFCPPGYERSQCGQTCTKCRPGTFKPSWNGTELCTKCPDGSNPAEDTIGLTDVEQCYDDGEDPRISSTDQTMSLSTPIDTTTHTGSMLTSTEYWTTLSGTRSTETTPVTKIITHSDWFTQSWTITEDACHGLCPLPPPTESQLCSVPVNQLFGCLHRCRYFKDDVVAELNEARQSMHLAVNNKIVSKLNEGVGWEAIFIWYHDECPEYLTTSTTEIPTSSDRESTSTTTPHETSEAPSSTTSTAWSTNSESSTTTTQWSSASESSSTTTPFTTASSSITTTPWTTEETSTAGDTTSEEQFSKTSESTPTTDQMSPVTCSHNIDCGPGGKCYAGYCGCLTMSCSGMAYAAIPGCGFYCQCNDPTKKWLIMECPLGTLFDEAFSPTCNHADTVGNETCYRTMECETESCVMPTAAALDMCDQYMMAYTRCLRSLHANCDLHPQDVHIAQEDQITTNDVIFYEFKQRLQAHFENSADVEQFYIDYMRGCFGYPTASSNTTFSATQSTSGTDTTSTTETITTTGTTFTTP